MTRDVLGNDLCKGDKIVVHPDMIPKLMIVEILQISEGGLVIPNTPPGVPKGVQVLQGGTIKIRCEWDISFNPTMPISVIRVIKAEAEKPQGQA